MILLDPAATRDLVLAHMDRVAEGALRTVIDGI